VKVFTPRSSLQAHGHVYSTKFPSRIDGDAFQPCGKPRALSSAAGRCVTIGVLRSNVKEFKYLLHLVLINPALSLRPSGHDCWTPMRYSVVGAIAVRLDYGGAQILGHSFQNLNHKHWMRLCSRLGVFDRGLDQLALQPQQRALAEWNSENRSYFQRNIWLQYHWQWLRIRKENPNLTSLGISLSEAVAADEAKAAKSNAVRVAA
jgi:hypothetical protein